MQFRAYNDGIGYRFFIDYADSVTVDRENVSLQFPEETFSWFPKEESFMSHYERTYLDTALSDISGDEFCSLPVLLKTKENIFVSVTDADLYDYPGLFLYGGNGNTLKSGFPKVVQKVKPARNGGDRNQVITEKADYIAQTKGERNLPWRAFIVSDTLGDLIESDMVFKLSRELGIEETDWINPGKVAWDWWNARNIYDVDFEAGINTKTYKYYIDFAAKYGLEYIILDEGWSRTTKDVTHSQNHIDINELVEYGQEKDVGIILWLLWKPLQKNMENILDKYQSWGVKGIKVDFMQRADQDMVDFYENLAKEAAERKLLVNYHGSFKPGGLRRKYPNVMSYEGVKGLENSKWGNKVTPEHDVTLPFTRMTAGPMDFTPGAMVNAQKQNFRSIFARPMSQGTRCHQVAMYVAYESLLQMLCDNPSNYLNEKETTEFISRIPVEWDKTRVLDAKVSDYLVIARKKEDKWYVSALTDWMPRDLTVDLSFLPEGEYHAEIMKDGKNAERFASDYEKVERDFDSDRKLNIHLAPGGGWAAIITMK